MTTTQTYLHPATIGFDQDEHGFAYFDSTNHCCEGCEEGHVGSTKNSAPIEIQVAYIEGMPEGALEVELRWKHFDTPQTLALSADAAQTLVTILAGYDAPAGWKRVDS